MAFFRIMSRLSQYLFHFPVLPNLYYGSINCVTLLIWDMTLLIDKMFGNIFFVSFTSLTFALVHVLPSLIGNISWNFSCQSNWPHVLWSVLVRNGQRIHICVYYTQNGPAIDLIFRVNKAATTLQIGGLIMPLESYSGTFDTNPTFFG